MRPSENCTRRSTSTNSTTSLIQQNSRRHSTFSRLLTPKASAEQQKPTDNRGSRPGLLRPRNLTNPNRKFPALTEAILRSASSSHTPSSIGFDAELATRNARHTAENLRLCAARDKSLKLRRSEHCLRKMRAKTTCLYSAASLSMWPRSLSGHLSQLQLESILEDTARSRNRRGYVRGPNSRCFLRQQISLLGTSALAPRRESS